MLHDLPLYVSLLFLATTLAAILWAGIASRSRTFLVTVLVWALFQALLGYQGFYKATRAMPPRLILGMLPALLAMAGLFLLPKGRAFMDRIRLTPLTYFHTIRIPVEVVLALLYHYGLISVYQTFEGTNFDLFSGITAPIVAYFWLTRGSRNKKVLVGWNILCLLLLLNVVITSAFALPTPLQQIAFDQPNVAILCFPFHLLPTVVVPLVLFAHLVAFRQLLRKPRP